MRPSSSPDAWLAPCFFAWCMNTHESKIEVASGAHLSAAADASTVELLRESMDEAKQLLRLEVALAKVELQEELAQLRRAAVGLGIAAVCGLVLLSLLSTALVLALGGTAVVALLVALGFAVVGVVGGLIGYRMLPKDPLVNTRKRLRLDIDQLREHTL